MMKVIYSFLFFLFLFCGSDVDFRRPNRVRSRTSSRRTKNEKEEKKMCREERPFLIIRPSLVAGVRG